MGDPEEEGATLSVSLRHLRLFESVARLSSVRQASEECHLSQPAVTQAIAKLEGQIGGTLLERRASGSYLNDRGKIFYRRVARLFEQMEEALEELGAQGRGTPLSILASNITRSQIRSLSAIIENGSFVQAARALDVSQASMHRAARDLERNLRRPLYYRTAFGIMATPPAIEFARKVKLALREIDWALEELEAAKGNFGSKIIIGAMPLAGSVMLASVLHEFLTAYPDASVQTLNMNADELLKNLRMGAVDLVIGLLRDPAPPDLINEPLIKTPYIVAARHGHPLTRKAQVSLDEIAGQEWVVGTPGASRRTAFDDLFAQSRRPHAPLETSSLATIRTLLAQGDRLTLLTSYELSCERDCFAAVPFGPITPVPSLGVTTRTNWLPTPLQESFLELFRKRIVGELPPQEQKMAG